MSRFLSKRFETLEAYVPGEQPQDMQYIKLNTNESPYPPSPKVIGGIERRQRGEPHQSLPRPRRESALKQNAAAVYHGVEAGEHFSRQRLRRRAGLGVHGLFRRGPTRSSIPDITYSFYPVYCALYQYSLCEDPPAVRIFRSGARTIWGIGKNIVIANPNAPTGIYAVPLSDIEHDAPDESGSPVVVVDEAYVDFGGESAVQAHRPLRQPPGDTHVF